MLNLNFEHPVTKKEIQYQTDKSFVIVYGKNGTGKTTLSRTDNFDKSIVFNEDYINKNVYSTGDSGVSITPANRKNISNIWIGENVIKEEVKRTTLEKHKKACKELFDSIFKEYVNEVEKYSLRKIDILADYDNKDFSVDLEELESERLSFSSGIKIESIIKDDKELIEKYEVVKNNLTLTSFISKIENEKFLDDLILKKRKNSLDNINKKITQLEKNKHYLKEIEDVLKGTYDEVEASKLISEMYKVHKNNNLEVCLFCGNDSITASMNKWKNLFENELKTVKNELLSNLENIIKELYVIISEESFQIIDKEIVNYLKNLYSILNESYINISRNEFISIDLEPYIKETTIVMKISNVIDEMSKYVLSKHLEDIVFYHYAILHIDSKLISTKDSIDTLMKTEASSYEKGVNEVLSVLGLDKEILISVNKRGASYTYEIAINGQNVDTLSDGQKHRLALALFLHSLIDKDLSNKTIVIDDPVVSLDTEGYLAIRDYLETKLISTFCSHPNVKLIVLTHDYQYLFIQLFDILEKPNLYNKTEILRLTENNLSKVDLEMVFTDDLLFYKEALKSIRNNEELRYLPILNMKVFRLLIDIKQREMGLLISKDVGISKMLIDKGDKRILTNFADHFYENFKSKKCAEHDPGLVINNLKLLESAAKTLGFNHLFNSEILNSLVEINIKNIQGVENTSPSVLIMESINNFMDDHQGERVFNYLNHPRNSFTKNLITLIMDDTIYHE